MPNEAVFWSAAGVLVLLILNLVQGSVHYGKLSQKIDGNAALSSQRDDAQEKDLTAHISSDVTMHARIDEDMKEQRAMIHEHAGEIGKIKGKLDLE